MGDKHIIVFDGECGLCHRLVRYIARRDRQDRFVFYSRFSSEIQHVIESLGLEQLSTQTVILLYQGNFLIKGRAVVAIAKELSPTGFYTSILERVPIGILDAFYTGISRYRKIVRRKKHCATLPIHIRHKVYL